jgi:hypothetical protein
VCRGWPRYYFRVAAAKLCDAYYADGHALYQLCAIFFITFSAEFLAQAEIFNDISLCAAFALLAMRVLIYSSKRTSRMSYYFRYVQLLRLYFTA